MWSELENVLGRERFQELNNMSPERKVITLRKLSEDIQNGPELALLQRHIVNLMEEHRSNLNFAAPVIEPRKYDVLILDITSADLDKIGEELEHIALAETSLVPTFPVRGILFGISHRMFLPLIVSKRSKTINVNFLFDTGSPNTYLRPETFAALGFTENTPTETNVIIHGTSITVYVSSNHFENVDLLGQDYMSRIRAVVMIDYPLNLIEVNVK